MRPIKLFRPHPSVSQARDTDVEALSMLYEALRAECRGRIDDSLLHDRYPPQSELMTWIGSGFEIYKAELRGEVAGALRVTFPSGTCLLDALGVGSRFRGEGVGRALLERGITRARRAGMNKVWFQVLPELDAGTTLYHAVGFRESARLPESRKERGLLLLELLL